VGTEAVLTTRAGATSIAVVTVAPDGEREFLIYRKGSADSIYAAEDVAADVIRSARILHVGSLWLGEPICGAAQRHAVRTAHEAGALVSVDVNLRPALGRSEGEMRAAAATPRRDLRRGRRDARLARSAGPDPRYCRQGSRYGRLRRRLHGQPARRYRGAGRRLRLGGAPHRHRPASRRGGRVRGDGGGGDGRAADLGPTRRPFARGSVSPAHRAQARAIGGVVDGRPPRNANSGRAKQKKPRADAFLCRSRETGHAALLQVGVAAEHRPMRIGDGARQFEDNRVEKNEARLLENAAPELSGRFDRGV